VSDSPRPKNATAIRLIVAPLVLAVVVGVVWIQVATGNRIGTQILLILMSATAGIEMALLLRSREPSLSLLHAGASCGLLAACPTGEVPFVLAACFIWLLLMHLRDTTPEAVGKIALGCVPLLFVGFLFSFLSEFSWGDHAGQRLIWIVVVAKASDMGGWLIGKPFGKHKMIPSVSPGKSWEGTAGGLAASVACAVFLPDLLGLPEAGKPVIELAGFGFLLGAVSILAGVFQSGWKRRLGAKDSSTLIPEMGGVLDMVDSLLLAAPAAAAWYALTWWAV